MLKRYSALFFIVIFSLIAVGHIFGQDTKIPISKNAKSKTTQRKIRPGKYANQEVSYRKKSKRITFRAIAR